jgi:hypothetical protein
LVFLTTEGILCSQLGQETLTPTESAILSILCGNHEKTIGLESLFKDVWKQEFTADCTGKVYNQIGSIRSKARKLGALDFIVTSRGRGVRLGVAPMPAGTGLADLPSLSADNLSTPELMKRLSLEGGLEKGSRVVIEAAFPLELQPQYSGLVWTNIENGGVSYVFLLQADATLIAAKIVKMILNSWSSTAMPVSHGLPVESRIAIDDRLINALGHVCVVLVPRMCVLPMYMTNADNALLAEGFIYDIQQERAIRISQRAVAHSQAAQLLSCMRSNGHQTIQIGVGAENAVLQEFEENLTRQSAGAPWAALVPDILGLVLRPRKPNARSGNAGPGTRFRRA